MMRLTPLPVLMILSGCATLDRADCEQGDWYGIGLKDGLNGQQENRIDAHREACAEHGVAVNRERYAAGREAGLLSYCNYSSGVRHGRSGHSYAEVCPAETEPDFLEGFALGQQIRSTTAELRQAERDIHEIEEQLAEGVPDSRQRQRLVEELSRRHREVARYRREVEILETHIRFEEPGY